MASPNFDSLHVYLSRKLQDPVALAGTDGSVFTSAVRTDYLNRANKFIQLIVFNSGRDNVDRLLSNLVKTQSIVWATLGTDVASDYNRALSCQHTATSGYILLPWVPPSRKIILDNDQDRNYDAAFTILGGKIYGYYNYAQLLTGSGLMYYMASDVRASSGDSDDIAIDSLWYDTLVDIAASFAHEDRGNVEHAKMNQTRIQMVMSIVGVK